ncbi:Hint domain-containing protein [Flavimaricola marinus]|uniref:Hedgehog/Intein (Hint) domain-containing protein n=1 Tax=Flavimaricola marinus TaxID=1819565 RepID=A0A238LFD9_9RHOB|nr:Hint domain-containing protein [Flavimaricola marinus]SMY08124.1 hypothetical protein LOM8899_02273 [Flavimaricola marinus]
MVTGVELTYDTGADAMEMAEAIFGDSVEVVSASYSGSYYSSAIYTNGESISPNVVPGDTGVILSTGAATYFTNSGGGSNDYSNTSYNSGGENYNDSFDDVAGTYTYDAAYMDIVFIPDGDVMTMQFVFASDEYPEYSDSIYNDVVLVEVNGEVIPLSVTNSSTSVTEINQNENVNLYNDNTADQYNTEMDGFTVTMTLTIPVVAGEENSIRIGIADASDSNYDSNLLIAGDSLQTDLVAIQDDVTVKEGVTKTVDVLDNDLNATSGTLVITHINDIAVTAGDTVNLTTGQSVTLNADGTLSITADSDNDTVSFTYETAAEDGSGAVLETDVGFVTVTTVPCFVAGTRISTPDGDRRVEDLQPGDLVLTKDAGAQQVRWAGRRSVAAQGRMAPVLIRSGTFGTHGDVMVSPLHRVLVTGGVAELLFAEPEVLVTARDLVNDRSVRRVEGGTVDYVHIMFDAHQVIYADGLATESFLPGPQTTSLFEDEIVAEICAIFPELDPVTGEGYSPAARRTLRAYEGRLLGQVA